MFKIKYDPFWHSNQLWETVMIFWERNIEQTHRLLWSTFLKNVKWLHKVTWKKHIFYEKKERLNYKLKETLLGDGFLFLNYSKLIRIYMCISGRRVCLGESLARMEFFLFFTAIVSRYRIVPIEGEQPPKIEGHIGTTHSQHHSL
jgi:hypothetical protein